MDSTGVKDYGEDEWQVHRQCVGKRRTWRKLHLLVRRESFLLVSIDWNQARVRPIGGITGDELSELKRLGPVGNEITDWINVTINQG